MIKPGPDLLPWMPRELAQVVAEELAAHGVGLYPGQAIQRIEAAGSQYRVVCQQRVVTADMILVAVGIRPNSELAADAGLALGAGNAIAVNRQLQTNEMEKFQRMYQQGGAMGGMGGVKAGGIY